VSILLRDIVRCLQGEIPAILATCSADGEPNVTHVSQVILVDDTHVATSNQFFSKTTANLLQNPVATLLCPHPDSGISYKLLVQHERSESSGRLFDAARTELEAIAAMTGMSDVFALRAIDVFRVLDVREVASRGTVEQA
jgi:adenylate cyclase